MTVSADRNSRDFDCSKATRPFENKLIVYFLLNRTNCVYFLLLSVRLCKQPLKILNRRLQPLKKKDDHPYHPNIRSTPGQNSRRWVPSNTGLRQKWQPNFAPRYFSILFSAKKRIGAKGRKGRTGTISIYITPL